MNNSKKIHSLIKEKLNLNEKTISLNDEILFSYQRNLTDDPVFIVYENGLVKLIPFNDAESSYIEIAQIDLDENQKEIIKEIYIHETGDFSVLNNEKNLEKSSGNLAFQLFYVSDLFKNKEDEKNINNIELSIYLNIFLTSLEVKFKKLFKK